MGKYPHLSLVADDKNLSLWRSQRQSSNSTPLPDIAIEESSPELALRLRTAAAEVRKPKGFDAPIADDVMSKQLAHR